MMKKKINELRKSIVRVIARNPNAWKIYGYLKLKALQINHFTNSRNYEPHKIIWVNPKKIKFSLKRHSNKYTKRGMVMRGDWDLEKKDISQSNKLKAVKERFVKEKNWQETDYYKELLKDIEKGKIRYFCKDKSELDERFKRLDKLYENIRKEGYKTQKELNKNNTIDIYDEITVSIGRKGELILVDGVHRFFIAKILGLKKIPTQIFIRHSKWHKFRTEILGYLRRRGKIYAPLTHPDLQDISSTYTDGRWKMIEKNLPGNKKGKMLDVGAHWGYFCHKFEELGFECYAVENDTSYLYFLRRLKTAENKKFKVVEKSIFDCKEATNKKFDVILALSIFHHFLKEKKSYEKLVKFLNNLDMKMMFFEPHSTSESQMEGAYKNYSPEEFVRFIIDNSSLNKFKLIGRTEKNRPLYKIYR